MPPTIAIRASHIIAYDGVGHRYLPDGVVVYAGNTIMYVGRRYDGPVQIHVSPLKGRPCPWRLCDPVKNLLYDAEMQDLDVVHHPSLSQPARLTAIGQRPPGLCGITAR